MKLHEHSGIVHVDGQKISFVLTESSDTRNSIAIMMHGGPNGSKQGPNNLFVELAKSLANSGIDSIRFDFRGEGESEGDYLNTTITSQQEDFRAVYRLVCDLGYKNIAVVGESFGATCALGVYSNQFSAIALLWPAIYFFDNCFAPFFADNYKQQIASQGYAVISGKKIGQALLDEITSVNNLEHVLPKIDAPTILVHGNNDSEVPHTQSIQAERLLCVEKKLVIVDGGDHCLRRPHEQKIVIDEVSAWFSKYINTGADHK